MLGGPMSVNDEATYPFLRQEKALALDAMGSHIPVIGHCLGGQLMSVALGGVVTAAPSPEIGWCSIQASDASAAQEWFGGRNRFKLFQWHNESFSIPERARRIATGEHCRNQAFVVNERHVAMQFHCEVERDKVAYWATEEEQDIHALLHLPSVQSRGQILGSLDAAIASSRTVAHSIYTRWIRGLSR
jgi:GMP synthase-like glutamine amidotransferase